MIRVKSLLRLGSGRLGLTRPRHLPTEPQPVENPAPASDRSIDRPPTSTPPPCVRSTARRPRALAPAPRQCGQTRRRQHRGCAIAPPPIARTPDPSAFQRATSFSTQRRLNPVTRATDDEASPDSSSQITCKWLRRTASRSPRYASSALAASQCSFNIFPPLIPHPHIWWVGRESRCLEGVQKPYPSALNGHLFSVLSVQIHSVSVISFQSTNRRHGRRPREPPAPAMPARPCYDACRSGRSVAAIRFFKAEHGVGPTNRVGS